MNPFIIKKPVFTEKSMRLLSEHKYTFEVEPKATKGQIKEAVEQLFTVKVLSIQTVTLKGKTKRAGRRRMQVQTAARKKAIVTIPENQNIEVFDIVKNQMTNAQQEAQA